MTAPRGAVKVEYSFTSPYFTIYENSNANCKILKMGNIFLPNQIWSFLIFKERNEFVSMSNIRGTN